MIKGLSFVWFVMICYDGVALIEYYLIINVVDHLWFMNGHHHSCDLVDGQLSSSVNINDD